MSDIFQSGMEGNDVTEWATSVVASGGLTASVTTTSARSGVYGWHTVHTGAGGATGDWVNVAQAVPGVSWSTCAAYPQIASVFPLRYSFWHQLAVSPISLGVPTTAIFQADDSAANFSGSNIGQIRVTGTTSYNYQLSCNESTSRNIKTGFTKGAWYRFEVEIGVPSSAVYPISVDCYDASNVLQGSASGTIGTAGAHVPNKWLLGHLTLINRNAAQEHYFDDFHARDGVGSLNVGPIGDRKIIAVRMPNADGATIQWTPTGSATHYQNIDNVAVDDTDFNTTAGGAPAVDLYGFANYTVGTTVKAASIQVRWKGALGSGANHSIGFLENGTWHESTDSNVVDTTTYWRTFTCGELTGAVAWTNTKFDGAEVKVQGTNSANATRVLYEVRIHVSESTSAAVPVLTRRRGAVV